MKLEPRTWRGRLLEAAGFLALYVALDWISYLQPLESAGVTPWNPPPGLGLAFLMRRGWRFAPVVFAAAFASDLLVRGATTTLPRALASSALFALGYGAFAAWVRRRSPAGPDFRRVGEISWFAGVLSPVVCAIGAAYVGLIDWFGPAPSLSFGRQLLQFWVGDVIGILVVTPALFVHAERLRWPRSLALEPLAQGAAIALALWLLWGFDAELAPRLFYVLFLPLVWIGIRRSIEGATLALVAIQFGLIAGLQLAGRGAEMVLELQLLMLTLAFTGLFLGASVSEWRRTERTLRERQAELDETLKLAAASETASALAHELNQPLTAIASYVGASQVLLEDGAKGRERLASALASAGREAARAGEVIRRMRDFFRSGAKNVERVAVSDLVEESVGAMQPTLLDHGIALRVECAASVGDVWVDRVQLESVLHQLVQNAVEAIAGADTPRREIDLNARREDGVVAIEVRDTGPGIDPELGEGVFSPFKTTKALGTGLGLSISRTIVENHGGRLRFSSSPAGTAFVLTLPLRREDPGSEVP